MSFFRFAPFLFSLFFSRARFTMDASIATLRPKRFFSSVSRVASGVSSAEETGKKREATNEGRLENGGLTNEGHELLDAHVERV